MRLVRFEVNEHPARCDLFEVQPFADRNPYADWRVAFCTAAEAAEDVAWVPSGAAQCAAADIERVKDRLRDIATNTNDRMTALLAVTEQQAERDEVIRLRRLLEAEAVAARSVTGQGCRIP